ncbi:AraC family transcriptional regulator [Nocardia yamanashiensis]|uniref:AraC family transcriptional regulator n=1 Tax=Nocardia yamanashiensis TaxID=209247 RepID=UPI0008359E12|nr:AraC family transcriptional regulator [Nocardia yamanashiensis]
MTTSDHPIVPRFLLQQAEQDGVDPVRLARAAGLRNWMLDAPNARVSCLQCQRLWEHAEYALGDPDFALRAALRYRVGSFELHDYLFATAPTLDIAYATVSPYIGLLTTNFGFTRTLETDHETRFELTMIDGEGRGRDLALQFCAAALITRARVTTDLPVAPIRVSFQHPAPRSSRMFHTAFGSAALEFDAPATSITLRRRDLDLPLHTADPALATILLNYADRLPLPLGPTEWRDRLAEVLESALRSGAPTLLEVACLMGISTRTLQRKLSECDTTWRRELDRARRGSAASARTRQRIP